MKRFLARPTRLHLSVLIVMIVLVIAVGALDVVAFPSTSSSSHVPWFSIAIAGILLPLIGAGTFVRSMFWMREEYPDRMYQIDMARRMAIRGADTRVKKYRAALAHMPLPLASVAFFWFFTAVLAAGVVLFATGVFR